MDVYNGPHLIITYEQECSRLISTWKSNPPNDLEYRKELIEHRNKALIIKPTQIMWLIENLTFKLSDSTMKWVDEDISGPIVRAGFIGKNKEGFYEMAFVVGKDVLAYLGVMNIFLQKPSSCFIPSFFATEKDAVNWFNDDAGIKSHTKPINHDQSMEINFKGINESGKLVFQFIEQPTKFNSSINSFKTIIEHNYFMKNNIEKYSSLTPREIETLKFIIKGYDNKQISEKMHISINTTRTHRNRIWQKLEIKHLSDCLEYKCFFIS